jgi:hypothetical protein
MKDNMTTTHRIIRVIIALIIAVLSYHNVIPGLWRIVSVVIVAVFLLTPFINFGPSDTVLGIRRVEISTGQLREINSEFNGEKTEWF